MPTPDTELRPSILGCRAKLARARHHLDELKQRVDAFFGERPYSTITTPDSERGLYVVRLSNPREMPLTDWALIIGDCVHNIRSSLDYLAWELAGADSSDRRTMFPIFDDATRFREHGKRRISRLPERAQAIIEKLQPFYQAAAKGTDPHKYSLWALETFDTGDKHRLLTLTAALPLGGVLRHQGVGGNWTFQPFPSFPFKDGAEIAHVRLDPFRPGVDVNLDIVINIAFDAALGTGGRQFVVEGLETILRDTTVVVDLFEREFFR